MHNLLPDYCVNRPDINRIHIFPSSYFKSANQFLGTRYCVEYFILSYHENNEKKCINFMILLITEYYELESSIWRTLRLCEVVTVSDSSG